MTEISFLMLLDGAMVLLLGVTIFYCLNLNTRIRVLQDSKSEFRQLIEQFDKTTQRAQNSIEELQTISKRVNDQLSTRLDKANFLADDLAFMIEKGGKLADKMEGQVAGRSNTILPKTAPTEQRRPAPPQQSMREDSPQPLDRDRKRASLDAVMNRVSPRDARSEGTESDAPRRRPGGASARLRSKAEQELYDALKSGGKA